MEPLSVPQKAENLVRTLSQIPPAERAQVVYHERLNELFDLLFENEALGAIGDLETLSRIRQVLLENQVDQSYPECWLRLEQHRAQMSDVHPKLATILDTTVDIRDVLYLTLDSWPQLTAPMDCSFSPDAEQELQAIRLAPGKPSERLRRFLTRYFELLEAGQTDSVGAIQPAVTTALDACAQEEMRATVHALFADPNGHEGRCYRVSVDVAAGTGEELTDNTVDEEMRMAARSAIDYAFTLVQIPRSRRNVHWSIEEPTRYEGRSIGLAIAVGVLAKLNDQYIDCYTAFTGTVDFSEGRVGRVEHIQEKLQAAQMAGMRRVFLPKSES